VGSVLSGRGGSGQRSAAGRALLGMAVATVLCALPADVAAAATSQLVRAETVDTDVQRLTYRYGPLVAAPGQNMILVGPVTIERPLGAGYVTRVKPNLVRGDGRPPPVDAVHMHHAVMLNLSRADATSPDVPERFYGFAEEKTIGQIPAPYGYFVSPTDAWGINYMLHNGTPRSEEVWIEYEIDWVSAVSARGSAMKPARPLWLDVENGKAYPVFDVKRGSGSDGKFRYPDQAGNPYGDGPRRNEWTADRDGTLIAGAGHLHPGGLWTDLELVRGESAVGVFRSEARYFDPNGPVSWDMAMTYTPGSWRVGVRKGDTLRVSGTYETRRASWYESMGLMLVYMADDTGGPDPFQEAVATRGEPTHGHLPEASNYGGADQGSPDPTSLPDGQTPADGVGIANFTYLPGDAAASGAFAYPPAVDPGTRLRFGNFDASAQIPHTITACKAPCNRSTGISYPLADGDVDFDSGQLGYGPQGYTATANRGDWETPADLNPGTYTYFCRVHPYMRGAFRVRGASGPQPDPGGPSGGRRASRASVGSRVLRMNRHRVVKLKLRCSGGSTACTGRVRLQGTRRGRRVTLGARAYRVKAGRTRVVHIRLSPRAVRHIGRRRAVKVRVGMAPRGPSQAGRARRLTLRASARRR